MKAVLIGFGYWGKILLKEIKREGHFIIKDIIEPNQIEGFDKTLGVTFHKNLDVEIWSDYVFFVATPAQTHFPICSELLRSGLHVFCEKPLTDSADSAAELINIAMEANAVLAVGHSYLHNLSIQKMKEILLPKVDLDPITFTSVRSAPGPIRKDVSCFWDLAAHDVSIFIYITNPSSLKINASGQRILSSVYDSGIIQLVTDQESKANIFSSWLGASKRRNIQVSKGRMSLEFDEIKSTNLHVLTPNGSADAVFPEPYSVEISDMESPVIREIRYFYSLITSQIGDPEIDLLPLKVVKVLEGVHISAETGKETEVLL